MTSRVTPPQQKRSQKTLERLVGASLTLLEEEGPEALTVQNVVKKARSSVGSFYARFSGKEDLLAFLRDDTLERAERAWTDALDVEDWSTLPAPLLMERAVERLAAALGQHGPTLGMIDAAIGAPDGARTHFLDRVILDLHERLLARGPELEHPDPDTALRVGLGATLGALERLGSALSAPALRGECALLLDRYLRSASAAAPGITARAAVQAERHTAPSAAPTLETPSEPERHPEPVTARPGTPVETPAQPTPAPDNKNENVDYFFDAWG